MPRKKACDSCHSKKTCSSWNEPLSLCDENPSYCSHTCPPSPLPPISTSIHCDGGEPRCEWCTHRDIPCTYGRAPRSRVMKSYEDATLKHHIAQRLARVEDLLQGGENYQIYVPPPPPPPAPLPPTNHAALHSPDEKVSESSVQDAMDWSSPATKSSISSFQPNQYKQDIAYGGLHFAGFDLGDISSLSGIPVFSNEGLRWIQERTGATALFDGVYDTPQDPRQGGVSDLLGGQLQQPSRMRNAALLPLPSKVSAQKLLQVFRSSPLRRIFPAVDIYTFEETIDRAYLFDGSDGATDGNAFLNLSARACVFAFGAFLSVLEAEHMPLDCTQAEAYASEARDLLFHVIGQSTIEGLQAAVMLCTYYDFSGNIQSASLVHAMAVRCVYGVKGHLNRKPSPSASQELSNNHIRDVFWLIYFFDKHLSLRTSQPASIIDQECDLSIDGYPTLDLILAPNGPLFPSDLTLTIIKSRVSTMLYSPSALLKSDPELLRDVRELDDQLEEWRQSIPPQIRPKLHALSVESVREILGHAGDFKMLTIFIHLEYLYLVSTIHRACGRCSAWADDEYTRPQAVSSSLALAVQASRSTLIYMRAASLSVHREAFWLVIFYPLWATLTVFCNILHDPLNRFVREDINTLESIPRLIMNLRTRKLTPHEMYQLKMLDMFVMELVRLAQLAVGRASYSA